MSWSWSKRSIVGVDPGGRHTGVVALEDGELVYSALVTRTKAQGWRQYAAEVVGTITLAGAAGLGAWPRCRIEDVVHPTPHLGLANVSGLLDTARLVGYLEAALAAQCDIELVRPAGFGGDPLAVYPPELVGDREKLGKGKLRHVRAAYDIARAP